MTRSEGLLQRARDRLPSAAQTYSKSVSYYCEGAGPAFLERGRGGRVWDVDGREYVDLVLGLGAVTLGHAHESVNRAIEDQLARGFGFALPTELEVRLAEMLAGIIPCAEMARFMKNGSDATTAAVRLARAHTGRDHVAMCGYHGWHDWSIATTARSAGIPEAVRRLVHCFEYNHLESLEKIFRSHPGEVAAVILEPVNQIPPENEFLQALRDMARREGAVLIFDEVVTGGRWAVGGAQEFFGVIPDLACFGKGIANGAPFSALVGSARIMRRIDEDVFISTTHGGEALSLAAAEATITVLKSAGAIERVWRLGEQLVGGIQTALREFGLESFASIRGYPCHPGLVFRGDRRLQPDDMFAVYQQAMLDAGVLCLPVMNLCFDHTSEEIDRVVGAAQTAFTSLRQAVDRGTTEGLLRGKPFRPVFDRHRGP